MEEKEIDPFVELRGHEWVARKNAALESILTLRALGLPFDQALALSKKMGDQIKLAPQEP